MREVVHRSGRNFAGWCRKQITRPLNREVDEEDVVRKEREHHRECSTLMISTASTQIQPNKRSVNNEIIRDVGEVQKLGQVQIRKSRSQLATRLPVEDLLFPLDDGVVEVAAVMHGDIENGKLRVQQWYESEQV